MAEYLAALTAVVTAVGGVVALAVAVSNFASLFRKGDADGREGSGRWIAAVVGVVLIVVGVLAFIQWREVRPRYHLAVEIQDKQSRPDRILAKKVFTGIAGRELSSETLSEISGWIAAELQSKNYDLEAAPIDIQVQIPEDASVEPVSLTPGDPRIILSYGLVRGAVANRISPTHLVPSLGRSYFLVVERPRYESVWLQVSPGTSRVVKVTLDPKPIHIAVGGFTCGDTPAAKEDETLAEQLEAAMVAHPQAMLYPLEAYQEIAQTLSNSPDSVVRQEPWELDLLIVGNYERV